MTQTSDARVWTTRDARAWIAVPGPDSDKYSRGVLGAVTGSPLYPGAAVLGVEAAIRTGVGMVRYLGQAGPRDLVLQRRPEAVTAPGRVQAWLLGSGMDAGQRTGAQEHWLRAALADPVPVVVDAGALDLVALARGPAIVTPHYRELARLLSGPYPEITAEQIAADPSGWATRAASELGVAVLLKGSTTFVASPAGLLLSASYGTGWLASAGTGDVLGGVLGALIATHSDRVATGGHDALARLGATAAVLHALAAQRACPGGPVAALDVAEALPGTVAGLLAEREGAA